MQKRKTMWKARKENEHGKTFFALTKEVNWKVLTKPHLKQTKMRLYLWNSILQYCRENRLHWEASLSNRVKENDTIP